MADNRIDPIDLFTPIVDPATGAPTDFFIQQWNAQREVNGEIVPPGDVATPEDGGLEGGGNVGEGISLSIQDQSLTPDTYGGASKLLTITVNQKGIVTAIEEEDFNAELTVEQDDVEVGTATTLNFEGDFTITDEGGGKITIEVTGGGGGGGGSGSAYFNGFSIGDNTITTFGSAYATRAILFTPYEDCDISAVWAALDGSSSQTYVATIARVDVATDAAEVQAIVGVSETVNGVASRVVNYRLPFASPVSLSAGVPYMLAVSRTDGSGTSVLANVGYEELSLDAPVKLSTSRITGYINDTALAVSDTFTTEATSSWAAFWLEGVLDGGGGGGGSGNGVFGPFSPPTTTDFPTLVSLGSGAGAVSDDSTRGLLVSCTGASNDNWYGAFKTASVPGSGTDTYIFRLTATLGPSGFPGCGFLLRNSSNGRHVVLGPDVNGRDFNFRVQRWNGASFNSTRYTAYPVSWDLWGKVEIDSDGTMRFYFSSDGAVWFQMYSENVSAWLGTLDQIGFASKYHTNPTYMSVPFFSDDGSNS